VFPATYELGFYIPEDSFLHSNRLENLKSSFSQGFSFYHRLGYLTCSDSHTVSVTETFSSNLEGVFAQMKANWKASICRE
jgi:hypothetical protein